MHGNVFEWCWDWYKVDYYGEGINDNPLGPASGQDKVCRGGSWFVYYYGHRASFRSMLRPAFRSIDIGFRIVRKQG
jgi:formylglycine-generating enzyme required for sulfatase activity